MIIIHAVAERQAFGDYLFAAAVALAATVVFSVGAEAAEGGGPPEGFAADGWVANGLPNIEFPPRDSLEFVGGPRQPPMLAHIGLFVGLGVFLGWTLYQSSGHFVQRDGWRRGVAWLLLCLGGLLLFAAMLGLWAYGPRHRGEEGQRYGTGYTCQVYSRQAFARAADSCTATQTWEGRA